MIRFLAIILALCVSTPGYAMLDITVMSTTPAALLNALVAHNIVKSDGAGGFVGVLPGVDLTWNSVPNPIVTSIGPPRIMDARKVYLVRLSHESDVDDDDGTVTVPNDPTPRLSRSKLVKWIIANSVAETITGADGKAFHTRRVGTTIWFVLPADAALFGAWQ